MHFTNMDAYFHMASHGDSDAYKLLYSNFLSRAIVVAKMAGLSLTKNPGISAEFQDFVDSLFFKIINEYGREKGLFGHYIEYCLSQRLVPKVSFLIGRLKEEITDWDIEQAELINAELITSEMSNTAIRREVEFNRFKMKIASPNNGFKESTKLKKKVALMIYAGFKAIEIKQKLKLTESRYRTIVEKLKKDEDFINLKLEMK